MRPKPVFGMRHVLHFQLLVSTEQRRPLPRRLRHPPCRLVLRCSRSPHGRTCQRIVNRWRSSPVAVSAWRGEAGHGRGSCSSAIPSTQRRGCTSLTTWLNCKDDADLRSPEEASRRKSALLEPPLPIQSASCSRVFRSGPLLGRMQNPEDCHRSLIFGVDDDVVPTHDHFARPVHATHPVELRMVGEMGYLQFDFVLQRLGSVRIVVRDVVENLTAGRPPPRLSIQVRERRFLSISDWASSIA